MIKLDDVLLEGSYLAAYYFDKHRGLKTRRVYYRDGRVMAYNGESWWQVCMLSEEQMALLKQTLIDIEPSSLVDLTEADATVYDAAQISYGWTVGDVQGLITNYLYPAQFHPVMDHIEEKIDQLEAEAIQTN